MAKNISFEEWKAKVDEHIANRLGGLTSDDIGDYHYASNWEDGISPGKTASEAIRYAKESFGF